MPTTAYPALLAERTLVRWMRGFKPSSTDERERRFRNRIQESMGEDDAREYDDIVGLTDLDAAERVLLLAGSLLVQHGQDRLWRLIYATVSDDPVKGGEDRFLEDRTAAVRRGEF
jgi:hypothetical protein